MVCMPDRRIKCDAHHLGGNSLTRTAVRLIESGARREGRASGMTHGRVLPGEAANESMWHIRRICAGAADIDELLPGAARLARPLIWPVACECCLDTLYQRRPRGDLFVSTSASRPPSRCDASSKPAHQTGASLAGLTDVFLMVRGSMLSRGSSSIRRGRCDRLLCVALGATCNAPPDLRKIALGESVRVAHIDFMQILEAIKVAGEREPITILQCCGGQIDSRSLQ